MKSARSLRCRCFAITLVAAGVLPVLPVSTSVAAPRKKVPAADSTPTRIVITADAPAEPAPTPLGPARPMTTLDASGTRRAPGEPRMITGSFIPQKFDLYANDANTDIRLQIFKASDLAASGKAFGGKGGALAPNYTDSVSSTAAAGPVEAPRYTRVRTRHVLDLRTVEPSRRLAEATRILGPERGRQLFNAFNRWQDTHGKRAATP